MGAGHHRPLFVSADSPVHRLPAEAKILATVLFVFVVVATPREVFWAFAIYGALLALVAHVARVPCRTVARRLVLEIPFLLFALFLPLVGQGEQIDVLGISLSVDGLWGAWNIVVKGTLGVAASAILVATTDVRDLLLGLERLRVPRVLTGIAGFMVRYAEVIAGEMRNMRIARDSRGYHGRWLWQIRPIAASAGALFIRSYERGERVHTAMLARGYTGAMPVLVSTTATRSAWCTALALPALAGVVAIAAATTGGVA
jgi:cobalt/nickel transport system permease protein